ncbi:DUF4349 domain-containing protein [Sphingobacterium deserti]|uniref:DUF4349 domain-containing protein n=1 Tax=Sphingobacterium deserti TaxID=1229276 RepID=A0A0B8T8Z7_9SPHI|nr:DUF4349 domain-containing protein [Sphingobacterium deserti]KGE14450.1 hypothetical protein DI53_1479 [Sphingobacterium deserti]
MRKQSFPLFAFCALLIACNKSPEVANEAPVAEVSVTGDAAADAQGVRQMSQSAPSNQENPSAVLGSIPQTKKIIRSGNLAIESKDIAKSKATLDALCKRLSGYYEQETLTNSGSYSSYSLVVRIPANQLDQYLKAIEQGDDKLTERSLRSEDVSLQYFDTESRLKSKRSYLERYQQMVAQAKNVKELLEIQEQIRQLQEEIDSQENVMRSLRDQVNFSSIAIQLFEYQANSPMGSQGFWIRLKQALADGWRLTAGIFLTVISLWPIFIVFGLLFFGWRKYRNSKSRQ